MRRGARAARRGFGAMTARSLFAGVLAFAGTRPVLTTSEYLIGGTGKVRSVYDVNDPSRTHVFDQADTAKQVALPAQHADFSIPCYTFTGVEYYDSTRSSAYWFDWYGGSAGGGFHAVTTYTGTGLRRLISTSGASAYGVLLGFNDATTSRYLVGNSAGTQIVNQQLAAAAATPVQLSGQYLEAGALPNEAASKVTGTAESNVNSAGAPAVADNGSTARFGASNTGATQFVGRVAIVACPPPLSAADRTALRGALTTLTGVAA